MTLRTLAREIRDYPATALFSLIWVLVFVALLAVKMREQPSPGWWRFLVLGIGDGHRFGDLTLRELGRGEIWRLITCTCVHYSVIHIALNLLAFYLLGTLLESWYGAPQFIFIYGVTGGLGNLVSALIRYAIGSDQNVHSGGGSVVIMGLIGLCAVMGWRSRTAMGSDLGWQMCKALGLTGLLGIAFRGYIDNWGHAGGAFVGSLLGLMHRWFLRQYSRPSAWGMGMVSALVIAGCAIAQVNADRREAPLRRDDSLRKELYLSEVAYRNLRAAPALLDQQADHRLLASRLDALAGVLDQGATRSDYRRLRELAGAAATGVLSEAEKAEFKQRAGALSAQLRGELKVRLREFWKERRKTDARNR
ncbi:MAG TPA: rhomboid family intramembrane serine protease [Isosphaeraceae bacterium]|nr:rhomboid family intramembrane serine protease [Isosphaeraceae bacterium]